MKEDAARPQINALKLMVGGGFVGAIFVVASAAIFLIGIPILRVMFPAAVVLGGGVALILRFKRHQTPGLPWLLSATENEPEIPSRPKYDGNPERSTTDFVVDLSAAAS